MPNPCQESIVNILIEKSKTEQKENGQSSHFGKAAKTRILNLGKEIQKEKQ